MRSIRRSTWLGGTGAALLVLALGGPPAVASDDEAVRAAALDFAEGWHTGDEERVGRALHPEFMKRRIVTEVLTDVQVVQAMDADALLRATREGGGSGISGGPLNLRIAVLDRHGDLAAVRVVSELYVDYLHMVRWQDRWVVLSVTWGTIAGPGE